MTFVFLTVGVVLCIAFLTKRTAKVTLNVAFLKAVTSVCFILTGLFAFVGNDACPKIVGALVATAGVWGLLGDIALDLKYVFKKYEESYLTAGFSSFLVGHIFYCFAMYFIYGFIPLAFVGAAIVGVLSFLFVFICEPIIKVKFSKYKPITAAYNGVLGFTAGLAISYAVKTSFALSAVLMAIGFILFALSDAVLAGLYFSVDEKKRVKRSDIILNHALYYSAQFIIAVSLFFVEGIK